MIERQKETGLFDVNYNKICVGDRVEFFGKIGDVCFTSGTYGIGFEEIIDWEQIEKEIPIVTGCDNRLYACENDNFISFWEIVWNFNCDDDYCEMVKIITEDTETDEKL